MKRFLTKCCLSLVMASVLAVPGRAHAQAPDPNGSPLQLRNAVGVILLSGLVGGILGLSTLSFYSKPQDNIRNIFFGAGAGMIVATLWMTMNVATSPLPPMEGSGSNGSSTSLSPKLLPSGPQFAPMVSADSAGVLMVYRF